MTDSGGTLAAETTGGTTGGITGGITVEPDPREPESEAPAPDSTAGTDQQSEERPAVPSAEAESAEPESAEPESAERGAVSEPELNEDEVAAADVEPEEPILTTEEAPTDPASPDEPLPGVAQIESLRDDADSDAEASAETDAQALNGSAPRTVRPLPRAVAVANQKGGVGKTTTAVNLSAGLAEMGYRVLVVDLDPQGNATTGLGINPRNLAGSVYDVLMNDAPLEDCIEPTAVKNLFVVPATIDLAGAEIELVPTFSRELKLRRAIDSLAGEYDYILIDCPPSLGLLTVNGLAAAGEVLVPIQCEYYALEGLGQLLKNIQLVQSNLNPRLELSTIVLTMYDARTRLADQVAREVREHFGPKVCRTIVPRTVRLSEAPSFGQPINVFDPASRGATAYRELAKEVSGGEARRAG